MPLITQAEGIIDPSHMQINWQFKVITYIWRNILFSHGFSSPE
jgi:hypothetical protein